MLLHIHAHSLWIHKSIPNNIISQVCKVKFCKVSLKGGSDVRPRQNKEDRSSAEHTSVSMIMTLLPWSGADTASLLWLQRTYRQSPTLNLRFSNHDEPRKLPDQKLVTGTMGWLLQGQIQIYKLRTPTAGWQLTVPRHSTHWYLLAGDHQTEGAPSTSIRFWVSNYNLAILARLQSDFWERWSDENVFLNGWMESWVTILGSDGLNYVNGLFDFNHLQSNSNPNLIVWGTHLHFFKITDYQMNTCCPTIAQTTEMAQSDGCPRETLPHGLGGVLLSISWR